MGSTFYPAIAFRSEAGDGYEFISPGVDGFTAFGEGDLFTATLQASAALTMHIEEMQNAGLSRPEAMSFEDVRSDGIYAGDTQAGGILVTLTAHQALGRSTRINMSLDENDLAIIDRAAAERGMTRSGYLRASALREAGARGGSGSRRSSRQA